MFIWEAVRRLRAVLSTARVLQSSRLAQPGAALRTYSVSGRTRTVSRPQLSTRSSGSSRSAARCLRSSETSCKIPLQASLRVSPRSRLGSTAKGPARLPLARSPLRARLPRSRPLLARNMDRHQSRARFCPFLTRLRFPAPVTQRQSASARVRLLSTRRTLPRRLRNRLRDHHTTRAPRYLRLLSHTSLRCATARTPHLCTLSTPELHHKHNRSHDRRTRASTPLRHPPCQASLAASPRAKPLLWALLLPPPIRLVSLGACERCRRRRASHSRVLALIERCYRGTEAACP